MTATILSGIAGVILSLLFSYVPKLNTKFAAKSAEEKKLWMLALLAVVAGGAFGLSCTQYGAMLGIPIVCTDAGLIELIKTPEEEDFFQAIGVEMVRPEERVAGWKH